MKQIKQGFFEGERPTLKVHHVLYLDNVGQ